MTADGSCSEIVLRNKRIGFGKRTFIMGILNVTPDSFSDGGRFFDLDRALEQARLMEAEGADIIDLGGESTRPGHRPVSEGEELERVLPVLRALRPRTDLPISIDTSKAAVARAALESGADMVNDVTGLYGDPRLAEVAAAYGVPVVIMHDGPVAAGPGLMDEIIRRLSQSLELAQAAGVGPEKVIVDPGIGFGKDLAGNLQIIRELGRLTAMGRPILLGPSRKSFIGRALGLDIGDRLEGTAASVAAGIIKGADIVRVHDIKAMVRVARMTDAIMGRRP